MHLQHFVGSSRDHRYFRRSRQVNDSGHAFEAIMGKVGTPYLNCKNACCEELLEPSRRATAGQRSTEHSKVFGMRAHRHLRRSQLHTDIQGLRMRTRLAAILIVSCSAAPSSCLLFTDSVYAQKMTIPATNRGWYDISGNHDPADTNFAAGDNRGPFCQSCNDDYRDFFVFDLGLVVQPIKSAQLLVQLHGLPLQSYMSDDPSETFEVHDVTTPIDALVAGTGGVAAHEDLGTGVVYGSRVMTAADIGQVVEIDLTAAAIADLNAAHGRFAIGGSVTTLDSLPNYELVFGYSQRDNPITELRLTLVPEPTTWALFVVIAATVGLFPRWHRECRQHVIED